MHANMYANSLFFLHSPFLKILQTRGRQGFKAFVEALRSRHGAWQGYLAELMENKCNIDVLQGNMN